MPLRMALYRHDAEFLPEASESWHILCGPDHIPNGGIVCKRKTWLSAALQDSHVLGFA